jgi:hypothetical protein
MGWISGAAWMVSSRDSGVTTPWNWCCGLLPLSIKLLSAHAINTTPHRPSRISHLYVTFDILLASFRPVNSIFTILYTPTFQSARFMRGARFTEVRISKMLLYIRFKTPKGLIQSASVKYSNIVHIRATKAYGGKRGTIPLTPNPDTRRR